MFIFYVAILVKRVMLKWIAEMIVWDFLDFSLLLIWAVKTCKAKQKCFLRMRVCYLILELGNISSHSFQVLDKYSCFEQIPYLTCIYYMLILCWLLCWVWRTLVFVFVFILFFFLSTLQALLRIFSSLLCTTYCKTKRTNPLDA